MAQYETLSSDGKFTFLIDYSEKEGGWALDGVEVKRDSEVVMPARPLAGLYPAQAVAIAHAISWCETIVKHLTTEELPR